MAKPTNRVAWGLAAILAAVLGGAALLFIRLHPYWVASHQGNGAWLQGASLVGAPLCGADLRDADLWGTDLRRADLRRARLGGALLTGARLTWAVLTDADLRGTIMCEAWEVPAKVKLKSVFLPRIGFVFLGSRQIGGADLAGADLTGARYDTSTRWPQGFDPRWHGAVKVP